MPGLGGRSVVFQRIVSPIAVAALVFIALLFTEPVQAQDRAGTVQGIVKDPKGAPVPGAFVKLKNTERRLTFMVISQAQGRYSVSSLPLGQYIVQAIGAEFQSELSAPVEVAAGKPVTTDLALTPPTPPHLPAPCPARLPGEQA